MTTVIEAVDYGTLTQRQQAMWSTGDFHAIARQTMAAAELVVQAADPHAGQSVLDIACGSGNAALVAARRYCEVAGIDYVPPLIERAKMRAQAEALEIDFRVADAQSLPFPDASFDVVVSVFGVMFAPDQKKAASELLRVCRPGGRIALASWMPERFGGDFFGAHARYNPPPPGLKPPVRWGTDAGLEELLGGGVRSISSRRQSIFAYYPSVDYAIELFRRWFGPTSKAFAAIAPERHAALRSDLTSVFERYNVASDGTAVIETEYLQTLAVRA